MNQINVAVTTALFLVGVKIYVNFLPSQLALNSQIHIDIITWKGLFNTYRVYADINIKYHNFNG